MATRTGYDRIELEPTQFQVPRKAVSLTFSNTLDSDDLDQWQSTTTPKHAAEVPGSRSQALDILRHWTPELISSIVSVASLVSLIIVLKEYDGRSLGDQRLPPFLTLNGLVALIATINRVALMSPIEAIISQESWLWFSKKGTKRKPRSRLVDLEHADSASRGVWGSLMFLIHGRGRPASYISAVITIISLAFGTFAQQLLTIDSSPVRGNSTATPIVGNLPRQTNIATYGGGGDITFPLKAAIYSGMMAEGVEPTRASCSTGNCTWPITPSLAVCGECINVTYTRTSPNESFYAYTMATGTVITLANLSNITSELCWQSVPVNLPGPAVNETGRQYIAGFDTLGVPYRSLAQGGNDITISTRCTLWWCVNAYLRSSTAGNQTETIINSTDAAFSNATLIKNGVVVFDPIPDSFNPLPDEVYYIDSQQTEFLTGALMGVTAGVGTCGEGYGADETVSGNTADAIWYATTTGLEPWMQTLVLSMSNFARSAAAAASLSANGSYYSGTAYQQVIRVRWPWITLPVAIVLSSLLLLAFEMISTARSDMYAWKSSPLAILFADVEPQLKQEVGWHEMTTNKGVASKIGKRRAVLEWKPSGRLKFVDAGVDDTPSDI